MKYQVGFSMSVSESSIKAVFYSAFAFLLFSQGAVAQRSCVGNEILTKKSCTGDEISDQEKEVVHLVNEYRKQKNLEAVALSESLSLVANRHVLDMGKNFGYLTHSWSDCIYKAADSKTWDCIFKAPAKFIPTFSDIGFENVYYTSVQEVVPAAALEAWKRSPLHNSVLLNSDGFAKFRWKSIGVAIDGKYAALWFVSEHKSGDMRARNKREIKGLGVTFEQAVKGLTQTISIDNVSSSLESNKWVGTSSDKSIVLEMYGKTKDISEGKIALRLRTGKRNTLSSNNRRILGVFVRNLAPDWAGRNRWLDTSLKRLKRNPKDPQKINTNRLSVKLSLGEDGFIALSVKPYKKPVAFEVK